MVEPIKSALYPPVKPAADAGGGQRVPGRAEAPGAGFADLLEQVSGAVRFSTHAQERMRARSIHLSQQEEVELARAIDAASAKGARESLILLDDLALVVSVRNRLVITALEQRAGEPSVFTHIDSAVLLRRASKEM